MMIRRSFVPVGQGAFFVETFRFNGEKTSVVYDCGSETGVDIVEKCIDSFFFQGDRILAVFISHFDEDHINGLPHLLKRCRVENLFFPFLTSTEKVLTVLKNRSLGFVTDVAESFLLNPRGYIESLELNYSLNLIQIQSGSAGDQYWDDNDIRVISSGQDVSKMKFFKESPLCPTGWEYVPFNFRNRTRAKKFVDALKECVPDPSSWKLNEIENNYNRYKQAIISAFKTVPGGSNTNSMALFSGIKDANTVQGPVVVNPYCRKYFDKLNGWNEFTYVNGCLYTGDYEAGGSKKAKQLMNAYKDYADYIGCVQVPHHGSRYNWSRELLKYKAFYVISAGLSNKYHHPHLEVVKDLRMNNKNYYAVNEVPSSKLDVCIW